MARQDALIWVFRQGRRRRLTFCACTSNILCMIRGERFLNARQIKHTLTCTYKTWRSDGQWMNGRPRTAVQPKAVQAFSSLDPMVSPYQTTNVIIHHSNHNVWKWNCIFVQKIQETSCAVDAGVDRETARKAAALPPRCAPLYRLFTAGTLSVCVCTVRDTVEFYTSFSALHCTQSSDWVSGRIFSARVASLSRLFLCPAPSAEDWRKNDR